LAAIDEQICGEGHIRSAPWLPSSSPLDILGSHGIIPPTVFEHFSQSSRALDKLSPEIQSHQLHEKSSN